MQAFDQIEKGQPHCNIQVLDLQRYRVLYDQPRCRLAVGYQELKEDAWCCIEDEAQHPINTHLRQALDKFYRQKGQDVMPLGRGGIAVRLRAVEDVLVQLVSLSLLTRSIIVIVRNIS